MDRDTEARNTHQDRRIAAPRDHEAVNVRQHFLTLLIQRGGGGLPSCAIEHARLCADFVLGTNDAEVIDAARRMAETVSR